ncbi:MAG: hypothetical protein EU549_02100 [Promethearchaeota archaeon]|nr:MAG: hypothetical protein EU549_02100 [Candidatus Lokiarchaeota archaeon]
MVLIFGLFSIFVISCLNITPTRAYEYHDSFNAFQCNWYQLELEDNDILNVTLHIPGENVYNLYLTDLAKESYDRRNIVYYPKTYIKKCSGEPGETLYLNYEASKKDIYYIAVNNIIGVDGYTIESNHPLVEIYVNYEYDGLKFMNKLALIALIALLIIPPIIVLIGKKYKKKERKKKSQENKIYYLSEQPSYIKNLVENKEFPMAIKKINEVRENIKKIKDIKLNDFEKKIHPIKDKIIDYEKQKIRNVVFNFSQRFSKVELNDIIEKLYIDSMNKTEIFQLLREVIREMIKNREINAEYDNTSEMILFSKEIEIEKIDDLISSFDNWEGQKKI